VATLEAILPDPRTVGSSLTSPLRMLYCSLVADHGKQRTLRTLGQSSIWPPHWSH
jgi:hypothetical protein